MTLFADEEEHLTSKIGCDPKSRLIFEPVAGSSQAYEFIGDRLGDDDPFKEGQ